MAEEQTAVAPAPSYGQLTQARVPLHEAAEAFSQPDANGRIPIVVIPQRLYRYLNPPVVGAGVVLVAGMLVAALFDAAFLTFIGIILATVLLILGIMYWFYVQVPEGVNALLARGGRYERTIGSGLHLLPPYLAVTHLVTRREIPFDVPLVAAYTADDVRCEADTLVTFEITDPQRFVFQISAPDYDQVFQAACQEALRAMIRSMPAERLKDLVGRDAEGPRAQIEEVIGSYGTSIRRILITHTQPPAEFVHTQEARQLAILQREEQTEKQALAQRRQADTEELARQQILARADHEREALEAQLNQLAKRRRIVEEEAIVEAERMSRLEERLRRNPLAAQWEWESAQLEVARALASNTRAILQVGSAGEIARALVMRETLLQAHQAETPEGTDQPVGDGADGLTLHDGLWLPDPAERTEDAKLRDDESAMRANSPGAA